MTEGLIDHNEKMFDVTINTKNAMQSKLCQGGERIDSWLRRVKGLSKKKKNPERLMAKDKSMLIAREKGGRWR